MMVTKTVFDCHPNGLHGQGSLNAEVLICGVAPAREEMKTGNLYSGETGKLLQAILEALNVSWDACYVTNLFCYWNKEPKLDDIAGCVPRLVAEIDAVKPKVIVALGALPIEFFTGYRRSGQVRGSCVWSETFNCWIVTTWQPTVVFQQGKAALVSDLVRDLNKINYIKDKSPDFGKVTSTYVHSPVQAQQILDSNWLRESDFLSLDVECEWGGTAWTNILRCVGISDGDKTYVFTKEALKGLRWPAQGVHWTFHNGMFDTRIMLENYGIELPIVDDTMLMSYSLDERGGSADEVTDIAVGIHGLKRLSREYCGADFYEVDLKKDPDEKVWEYNGKDAAYTARLARLFRDWQIKDNVVDFYNEMVLPQAPLSRDEHIFGIHVDKQRINQLTIDWGDEWIQLEEELQKEAKAYGWPEEEFNFNSPVQMKRFLSAYLDLPVQDARKETLDKYSGHPWVKKYQRLKRIDKQLRTYVIGTQNYIAHDGRIHPEPSLHGTTSGRLTYHRPPVGTFPTGSQYIDPDEEPDEETAALIAEFSQIRGLIDAPPGKVFIEADYATAELWTAAFVSGDPVMLEDLLKGDFHSAAAETIFHVKRTDYEPNHWKQIRRSSKYVTFGVLYLRSGKSLFSPAPGQGGDLGKMGYTLAECNEMVRAWHERYSVHMKWAQETIKQSEEDGEYRTVSGRVRRYHAPAVYGSHFANMAVNVPIQITSHDHLIKARLDLYELSKRGEFPARTLFDGHDAIYFECDEDKVDIALPIIKEVMTKPRWFKYGIPVDIKVGHNWADAKEVKVA